MSVTNGYNDTVVLSALETRIGWKQPTDTDYAIVDDDNQVSASGKYFNSNSFHASLTIQNILDCQPDEQLLSNPDLANEYLSDLRKENALSALTTVFNAESTPQFIESGLIFEKQPFMAKSLEANGSSFVGIRFKLAEGDFAYMLNNVTLQFDSAKTFNLHLYHEFAGLIKTWSVTTVADTQVIKNLDEIIKYNSSVAKDGVWFLGYYQTDLGSTKAISYGNCDKEEYKTFSASPFKSNATSNTSFDKVTYGLTNSTYGLNVEVSAYRDLTEKIVTNAHLFDNLQGLMMVQKCIDIITNSPRSNRTQRVSDANVNYLIRQLNGYSTSENTFVKGIIHKIAAETNQVRNAFLGKSKNMVISCYS
jgi:hypothetical protein